MVEIDVKRLQMADKNVLEIFFKANGFEVKTKIRPPIIYLWLKGRYIGNLAWKKKLGWVPTFTGPTIHTHEDMKQVLHEFQTTSFIIDQTDAAWDEFHKSQSQKRWQVYQGHQASFYCRLGSGDVNHE